MSRFSHFTFSYALPVLCALFCIAGAANVGMSKWVPAIPWAMWLLYFAIRNRRFALPLFAITSALCVALYGAQRWMPELYWTGFGETIVLEQPTVAYDTRSSRTLSCLPADTFPHAEGVPAVHVPPGAYPVVGVESHGGIDVEFVYDPVVSTPVGRWPVARPRALEPGSVFNFSCVNLETWPRVELRRWAEVVSFPMYYPFLPIWAGELRRELTSPRNEPSP